MERVIKNEAEVITFNILLFESRESVLHTPALKEVVNIFDCSRIPHSSVRCIHGTNW
jgi:hypothetical protein